MTRPRKLAFALVALLAAGGGCRKEEPRPINVDASRLTIDNLSDSNWSRVEIWMNDHYRVLAPGIEAHQRLIVPLDSFVEGYGRRFDTRRQAPWSIEVTATAAGGAPVKLVWGKERWKVGERPKSR